MLRFDSLLFRSVLSIWAIALTSHCVNAQSQSRSVRATERTIPVPTTVSAELQEFIRKSELPTKTAIPDSAEGWRELQTEFDQLFAQKARVAAKSFGISTAPREIQGVRCFSVTPKVIPPRNQSRLLVHVHGGGYVFGAGEAAMWEATYVANACQTAVLSIDYRMPPDHPFPAAIEDVVAVWRDVVASHSKKKIGLFGSSAGGGLALATTLELRNLNLRQPDAMFLGTPWADLTKTGDSYYTNATLDGVLGQYEGLLEAQAILYAGNERLSHPLISPINGDFAGLPPTILISGTRDLFLSNTVRTHRKLREVGVPAYLHVFEGQSHGHYLLADPCPESADALREIADFFELHLSTRKETRSAERRTNG